METSRRAGLRCRSSRGLKKPPVDLFTDGREQTKEESSCVIVQKGKKGGKKVIVETVPPVATTSLLPSEDNKFESEDRDDSEIDVLNVDTVDLYVGETNEKSAGNTLVDLNQGETNRESVGNTLVDLYQGETNRESIGNTLVDHYQGETNWEPVGNALVDHCQGETNRESVGNTPIETGIEEEKQKKEDERQKKDDVLSVVIQKLTELVQSSEGHCSQSKDSGRSGCSSGTNTPPRAAESKKKTRKRHHKSLLYKCPNCPCLFAIRKRDVKKGRKILCTCCEKVKRAKAAAIVERGLEGDSTPLQVVPLESWKVVCDVCSQWVSDYTSLLYHLASHSDVQIFKCKLCDFVTTKKGNIESHQASHRPREIDNKFVCSLCKFSTNKLPQMEGHLKCHDEKKLLVLKCSVCGYTCRSEEVLRYHMVTHVIEPTKTKGSNKDGDSAGAEEENDIFKCTVCRYSCDKLSTLKSHSWRHAGNQSCSYPVEECDDPPTPDVTVDTDRLPTGADEKPADDPTRATERDEDLDGKKDLSRLAIGCCDTKGGRCCSEEGNDECCCHSINVPASQQPVLEVILNEIFYKTSQAVTPATGKDIVRVEQEAIKGAAVASSSAITPAVLKVDKPPSIGDGRKNAEKDSNVEDVLEQCSSLIMDFCDKKDNDKEGVMIRHPEETLIGGSNASGNDQRLILDPKSAKDDVQLPARSSGEREQLENSQEIRDDGAIIVVVENMNIDSLLDNTASVVEVTTSEEPHSASTPSSSQEDVKVAIKRLLSPDVDGGPCAKRFSWEDTAGISNLLLNVVEDLVERPPGGGVSISKRKESERVGARVPGGQINCPFCSEQLSSFTLLKKHLLDHCREAAMLKCPSCPSEFTSRKLLASHRKEHAAGRAAGGGYVADPAAEDERGREKTARAEEQQLIVDRKETCTEGSASTNKDCPLCTRKFRTKAALYLHEQECTAQKKAFVCSECDFVGDTREGLKKHQSESHKKPFKCALCDYTSATPSGVKNHMKFHAVDKPYRCHLCNFSGAYPQSLRSHLKVHTNADESMQMQYEQFKCKLCGYISCHLPSMKSHMWRHARDPGFDYNMVDDIIKDAAPVVTHGKVPASQGSMVYVMPNVVPAAQNRVPARIPESTKEKQSVGVPGVPLSGPAVLIFQCTQCGFQSNSQDGLIEHLKRHLSAN